MQMVHEHEGSALNALRSHLESLRSLCESITAFTASQSIDSYKPPIIDRSTTYADNSIGGLAKFESLCTKELDHHVHVSLPETKEFKRRRMLSFKLLAPSL